MKTLVAYFSYTGHTRGIAERMKALTGGELYELRPAVPYSDDYDTTEAQGRKETRDGYHPPLAGEPMDLNGYDTIFLGTPNWFNTIAPPVAAFLADNELAGKTIIPFCTNGGGGLGRIVTDICKLAGGATVLDALSIYEDGGARAEDSVKNWLKKNGLKS